MYNVVTVVDNTVLYFKKFKKNKMRVGEISR